MNRKIWEDVIGHLRNALLRRSRDPDLFYRTDWDKKEIRLPHKATDDGAEGEFQIR